MVSEFKRFLILKLKATKCDKQLFIIFIQSREFGIKLRYSFFRKFHF